MTSKNYHRTITVNASVEEAMKKISQVNLWWKKDFSGSAEKLNDKFTVPFGEPPLLVLLSANLCQTKKWFGKLLIVICPGFKIKKNGIIPKLFFNSWKKIPVWVNR